MSLDDFFRELASGSLKPSETLYVWVKTKGGAATLREFENSFALRRQRSIEDFQIVKIEDRFGNELPLSDFENLVADEQQAEKIKIDRFPRPEKPDLDVQILLDYVDAWKPEAVLECGCNYGRELFFLEPFTKVFGVDLDPEKIAKAQEDIKSGAFFCEDAKNLHFSSNTFDLVYSDGCLTHNPLENAEKILAEMLRVSKRYVILIEYLGTRTGGERDFFENVKKNTWIHSYDRILMRQKIDSVIHSFKFVLGIDQFCFYLIRKGASV